jgi:hypothetical protein
MLGRISVPVKAANSKVVGQFPTNRELARNRIVKYRVADDSR